MRNRPECWSLAFATIPLAISLLVLVGWSNGWDRLTRIDTGYPAMVPSTALCFALMSIGLIFVGRSKITGRPSSPMGVVAAGLTILIVLIDIAVPLFSTFRGIDALLWPATIGPDFMAVGTAASFVLSALALAGISHPRLENVFAFPIITTTGLMVALIAIMGYAFDASALYRVLIFTSMALHTAIGFSILFIALLLMEPRLGWIAILLGDGSGSLSARRLFPIVIAIPLALCFITYKMTNADMFSPNFALSLLAILMMAIIAGAVLYNARHLDLAENQLLATMGDLQQANADKELLLREVYHRVKNNLQQINALFRIEGRKLGDANVIAAFQTMSDRVHAIGMVHQLLIAAPTPSQVQLGEFLPSLCGEIAVGHGLRERGISISTYTIDFETHLDVAVSVGLLLNELLANAIKHGFGENGEGRITVSFERIDSDNYELCVADNGHGKAAKDGAQGGSGTLIINSLVQQLKAKLMVENPEDELGTVIRVQFPSSINEVGRYA